MEYKNPEIKSVFFLTNLQIWIKLRTLMLMKTQYKADEWEKKKSNSFCEMEIEITSKS